MIFISTSDLMPPGWQFLAPHAEDPGIGWETHSGLPRTFLERHVPRPHLGRWRAARTATASARAHARAGRQPVLVSHLPIMGAATNILRRLRCPDVPQIAFSFNFTDLPGGRRLAYMRRALRGIDEFVVYSRFEQELYATLFDLPPDRVRFLPWAMAPPEPGARNPMPAAGRYLCAVGGEGRDYARLAQAMAGCPDVRMGVVARPHSIRGVAFPDNVTVFTNLPADQTWRLAADSAGMVIPLRSDRTACGHITLVGAQLLGIPLAVTRSHGVADYVDDATARLVPAGDASALRNAVKELADGGTQVAARAAAAAAKPENRLANWVAYFSDLGRRYAPG